MGHTKTHLTQSFILAMKRLWEIPTSMELPLRPLRRPSESVSATPRTVSSHAITGAAQSGGMNP